MFNRPGRVRERGERARQDQAVRPHPGPPAGLEEGVCAPQARSGHQLRGRRSLSAPRRRNHCLLARSNRLPPPPCGGQVVNPDLHKGEPHAAAAGEEGQDQRTQQPRPRDRAPSRRRPQAPLPRGRLQARQGRHRRQDRAFRVRPEPFGPPGAGPVQGRRAPATSWRRRASRSVPRLMSGPQAPIKPGKRHAAAPGPGRQRNPQRRAQSRAAAGRSAVPPAPPSS